MPRRRKPAHFSRSRRWLAGICALYLGMLIVLTTSICAAAAEDLLGGIRDNGRLVIAVPDREISPFVMRDSTGGWSGLDPALARELAGILGVEAVFVPLSGSADAVLSAVADGRAHLGMGRLSRRLDMAGRVALSRPYTVLPSAVLYNRLVLARTAPGIPVRSLLDRVGTRVGMLRESAMQDYLSLAHPESQAYPFADLQEATEALRDGEPPLLLMDRPRLRHWLSDHAGIGLEAGYEELPSAGDALVIAVPWHSRRLLGWLNGTLDILDEQGVLTSLEESHLEAGVTPARATR